MTEVNGIVGNTQQAAADATIARQATKVAWQDSPITHVVIGLTILVVSYILLSNLQWSFFWKILTGFGLMYTANKMSTDKSKLTWKWPTILKGIGFGILLLTVLQSGFVQLVGYFVNQLEKTASSAATNNNSAKATTPEPETVQVLENDKYHSLPIGRNFHQVFIIPANGAYFSPTESPCAVGYNDALFISTGVGHKEDPWSITQVIPKSGTATQGRIHLNCK